MDDDELRRSAALEEHHWWYAGRRALVRRLMRDVPPGRAVDVGPGPGGNAAVLRDLGWQVTGVELTEVGARLCAERGLDVVRGDATRLPVADQSVDLVMSTDVWEHVEDHEAVAAESFRVLRTGGRLLVAVPAGMDMWSGHDVALGHVRRYERQELLDLVERHGFLVQDAASWNVLLRPVARLRRSRAAASGDDTSEMEHVARPVNAGLRAVLALESVLPMKRFRGLSLVVRAYRP
ncbi:class I SAM-dependent methyltransferase [Nocardioides dilutus]